MSTVTYASILCCLAQVAAAKPLAHTAALCAEPWKARQLPRLVCPLLRTIVVPCLPLPVVSSEPSSPGVLNGVSAVFCPYPWQMSFGHSPVGSLVVMGLLFA